MGNDRGGDSRRPTLLRTSAVLLVGGVWFWSNETVSAFHARRTGRKPKIQLRSVCDTLLFSVLRTWANPIPLVYLQTQVH